ncbi:MAG: type II secretion system protein GspC [Gammaproteobacteria bacterium]|nr:type II secretion system protein GspC [Gammaproteobacteria bacterium]
MADWGTSLRTDTGAKVIARLAAVGTDKRLPLLVLLLLVVLLAQSLAQLTWQVLPSQSSEPLLLPRASFQSNAKAAQPRASDINRIGQWHLFGEIQKVSSVPMAQMTEAPDTRLNLQLHGLLASSDPAEARAIIADGKGVEEAYAIDQKLPGNAVLREIYADRVILEHRGRLETLRLPKDEIVSAMVSRTAAQNTSRARGRGITQAGTADNAALLRQYRDALMSEPQTLMNLVNASPVTDRATGRLKGYRIRPGKDRKLLGRFGLKSGDVVTGVNGVALDNPIKALEIMRDLSTADSVTLDVERNGVMESFAFQVE